MHLDQNRRAVASRNAQNEDQKTNSPFLTIGIASYNYGGYLQKAFACIREQTFSDYEILYCDDGSTDDSTTIIREIMKENPTICIRLVEGPNQGILANKNRLLEQAKGQYLMLCDADDHMLPCCLEALCGAARQENADCVIGGFVELDSDGRVLKQHVPPPDGCKWLYTWHHAQIYRTSILKKHAITFRTLPDDVDYLQRIHLHAEHTVFVPRALYAWVRHSDSVSTDFSTRPEWNPTRLWENLSAQVAAIREQVVREEDRNALDYYLYKWFYFNIADLPVDNRNTLKASAAAMRQQMKKVIPDCRRLSRLCAAMQTKDTVFAKFAISACWAAEGTGAILWIARIRTWQHDFRGRRQRHE